MAIVINTKSYDLASANGSSTVYRGPAATFAVKDQLAFKVTPPKATATFAGMARSSQKTTRTFVQSDGTTAEAIVETITSIPAKSAEADVDSLIADHGALITGSTGKAVVWKHDTNH
jgi:cysteine synthase